MPLSLVLSLSLSESDKFSQVMIYRDKNSLVFNFEVFYSSTFFLFLFFLLTPTPVSLVDSDVPLAPGKGGKKQSFAMECETRSTSAVT